MAWIRCIACHSPFFALLSNASGVPAQPLVMQSNSQFLHWILSPPRQGFPPLANFELHMRFQTATHFIYFWIFRCCPPPTPLYIHYRLYWYFVLFLKKRKSVSSKINENPKNFYAIKRDNARLYVPVHVGPTQPCPILLWATLYGKK